MNTIYMKLPHKVYALSFAQLVNRSGCFVIPLLTLLLTKGFGLSVGITSMVVTVASLMSIPGSLLGGVASDKIGEKKAYLAAQGLSALSLLLTGFLFALSANIYLIVLLIMFSVLFNGASNPAINTLLIRQVPVSERSAGFSLLYLAGNIGAIIGPVIATYLFDISLEILFIADAATTFAAILIVKLFITDTKGDYQPHDSAVPVKGKLKVSFTVVLFLIIYAMYSFVYIQHQFSMPLYISTCFPDTGVRIYGKLIGFNAIVVLAATMFLVDLTKRRSAVQNMVLAGCLYTIGFSGVFFSKTVLWFFIFTFIWTTGEILAVSNYNVYLADHSPKDYIARFNSLGTISYNAGNAAGPLVMGLYIQKAGYHSVYLLILTIGIISTLLMYFLQRREGKKEE